MKRILIDMEIHDAKSTSPESTQRGGGSLADVAVNNGPSSLERGVWTIKISIDRTLQINNVFAAMKR